MKNSRFLLGKCRICSKQQSVDNPKKWLQSRTPRCTECGGVLDQVILTPEERKAENRRKWWIFYNKYLARPHWAYIRRMAIRHAKFKCQQCQTKENLEVHHLHYGSLGHETLEDLVVLCRSCHEEEHERLRQGGKRPKVNLKPRKRRRRRNKGKWKRAVAALERQAQKKREKDRRKLEVKEMIRRENRRFA